MAMESSSFLSCDKLDRVVNWVGASVSSAFFASLERCSCITLSTTDNDDEVEEEAKDRPLMLTKPVAIDGLDDATAPAVSTNPSVVDKLPPV
ncbi:hypothetical protein MUK42_08767 [Musa troglodytarum]|uniref:Uncharacterized protein n=1 Tax=Musa troglodytarum TaxID=320322 RepID=A0A9E7EE03_9LILI|nr:hypothetical protein MUK42_08767 [Musa troglodytarum]